MGIDPGQVTDTSPEYVLKFSSEDFLHPGQSSGFEDGRKTQDMFVKREPFGIRRPLSRLRRAGKCLFNALAYNCDFQDAIGAAQEASYWGSGSPGRKKRTQPVP